MDFFAVHVGKIVNHPPSLLQAMADRRITSLFLNLWRNLSENQT
jgi:hypothetical protein